MINIVNERAFLRLSCSTILILPTSGISAIISYFEKSTRTPARLEPKSIDTPGKILSSYRYGRASMPFSEKMQKFKVRFAALELSSERIAIFELYRSAESGR